MDQILDSRLRGNDKLIRKPLAVWDIDGTIFRSSLVIELFKRIVAEKIFPSSLMAKVLRSEQHWLNRQGNYDEYMWDVVKAYRIGIKGQKRSQILKISRAVIGGQKYRTYRFTRDLFNKLRKQYFLLAISGSPMEVVGEYNKFLKFDKVYATEFGVNERGFYTGQVIHEPPRYKKELVVRFVENHGFDFKNSVGVGDTESDIGFLELVDKPIAFNPNAKLADYAKKKNWNIVIERKDLVVEFKPKSVKFLKI